MRKREWELKRTGPSARTGSLLGVAALVLAGSAVLVNRRASPAEREYLPKGRFGTVDGVRLHYVEKGKGLPVVFLHDNGAMIEDMLISWVVDQAASAYRAIVFDRPGFGHSERTRVMVLDGCSAGNAVRHGRCPNLASAVPFWSAIHGARWSP